MIAAVVLNVFLYGQGVLYEFLLYAQATFYVLSLFTWALPRLQRVSILRIMLFFVVSNMAIFFAWLRFAAGKSQTIWEPTER